MSASEFFDRSIIYKKHCFKQSHLNFQWLDLDEFLLCFLMSLVSHIYLSDHWGVFQQHLASQAQPVVARSQPDSPVVALSQYQRFWSLVGIAGGQISGRFLWKVKFTNRQTKQIKTLFPVVFIMTLTFGPTFPFRRNSILIVNCLSVVGACLMSASKASKSFEILILGRLLFGLFCGLVMSLNPLYIQEVSPTNLRGAFATLNQVSFAVGILVGMVRAGHMIQSYGSTYIYSILYNDTVGEEKYCHRPVFFFS